VTVTTPESVVKVVVSTLVPGTYSREVSNGSVGAMVMRPPCSASTSAANTGGESRLGMGNQSMLPSRATRATVRPSPIPA
jgi:hypothetical protein